MDMFLMQTGLEPTEVLNRVEGFEPMLQSIQRLKESYGIVAQAGLRRKSQCAADKNPWGDRILDMRLWYGPFSCSRVRQ